VVPSPCKGEKKEKRGTDSGKGTVLQREGEVLGRFVEGEDFASPRNCPIHLQIEEKREAEHRRPVRILFPRGGGGKYTNSWMTPVADRQQNKSRKGNRPPPGREEGGKRRGKEKECVYLIGIGGWGAKRDNAVSQKKLASTEEGDSQ